MSMSPALPMNSSTKIPRYCVKVGGGEKYKQQAKNNPTGLQTLRRGAEMPFLPTLQLNCTVKRNTINSKNISEFDRDLKSSSLHYTLMDAHASQSWWVERLFKLQGICSLKSISIFLCRVCLHVIRWSQYCHPSDGSLPSSWRFVYIAINCLKTCCCSPLISVTFFPLRPITRLGLNLYNYWAINKYTYCYSYWWHMPQPVLNHVASMGHILSHWPCHEAVRSVSLWLNMPDPFSPMRNIFQCVLTWNEASERIIVMERNVTVEMSRVIRVTSCLFPAWCTLGA